MRMSWAVLNAPPAPPVPEPLFPILLRALRIILPSQKYDEALITTKITSLRDRREKLCEPFFEKNIDNENLKDLLPQTILSGYDLRPICKYHNYVCRTERFKNSRMTKMHAKALTCFNFFNFHSVSTKFRIDIEHVIVTNRIFFVFRIATFLAGK
jgi:hypothetical protein